MFWKRKKQDNPTETFKKLYLDLTLRVDVLEEEISKLRKRINHPTRRSGKSSSGDLEDTKALPKDAFDDIRKIDQQLKELGYPQPKW